MRSITGVFKNLILSLFIVICCSLFVPGLVSQAASLRGKSNEEKIFYFFMQDLKFNNAADCGVLANIYRESSFNPAAVGDNGTSFGICQWHNDRASRLRGWCKDNDYDWQSMEGQLNYLAYELQTYYPNTFRMVKGVKNSKAGAYEAAYNWCCYYEIPVDTQNTAKMRGSLARDMFWPKYKDVRVGLKKGTTYEAEGGVYKATGDFTVTFVKPADPEATSLNIPAKLTINEVNVKVTQIAKNACKDNKNLEEVTIGKSVTKIGNKAFYGCENLKKIKIQSTTVESFGKQSFKNVNGSAVFYVKKKVKADYTEKLKKAAKKKVKVKKL